MTSPPPEPGLLRRTLRRRWVPIFTQWAILTVALLSTAYVLVKPSYRASSLIALDPEGRDYCGLAARPGSFESLLQTHVQLISSSNVLSTAGADPKAAALPRISSTSDVVQEVRQAISVQVIPGTYLIEVSMTSPSASEAATLVNAVVGAYLESHYEWAEGMTRAQIKSLESHLADLRRQTDEVERRWKDLVNLGDASRRARESNLIGPEHGAKIDEKLIENDLKRVEAQGRLDALRGREARDPKKVEELETEVEALKNIDRALNARRASGDFDARTPGTDAVEITLVREQREKLKSMQEKVMSQLEHLKFVTSPDAQVRLVGRAMPPGRPLVDHRLSALLGVPLVTFAAVFALFAGIEAWSGASLRPSVDVGGGKEPTEH